MCKDRSVHCTLIYKVDGLACQIIQAVQINRLLIDRELAFGFLYIEDGLKENTAAVLNKLTHRMQIGRQINRCREDTLLVFSFALSVQLLPPLRYVVQARLVVCKHLDGLALAQKNVAQCRILQCIVLLKCILKCVLSSGSCALHQFIDICSADCDRQKSYCG